MCWLFWCRSLVGEVFIGVYHNHWNRGFGLVFQPTCCCNLTFEDDAHLGVKTEGGDIISETKRSSNVHIVLLNLIVVVVPVAAVVADLGILKKNCSD